MSWIAKIIIGLLLSFLITWAITPTDPIEIETISGDYSFDSQTITFYPNETWMSTPTSLGRYKRDGKNVTITGRFIHEDFRILKNKSLRDSRDRVWKKKG